jgi:hypothetical protein
MTSELKNEKPFCTPIAHLICYWFQLSITFLKQIIGIEVVFLNNIIQTKQTLNINIKLNASSPFNTKVFMFIHE